MKSRFVCLLAAGVIGLAAATGLPGKVTVTGTPATTRAGKKPVLSVSVDPRVELMSIIFRLAGNGEYRRGRVASYTADVDKHFGPFKGHAVVKLAARLRRKRGVSYDAPMSLAVHVTDALSLKEKIPFRPHPPRLDRRWRLAEVREFLKEARLFVKASKFKQFIDAHQGLYDKAAERMRQTVAKHAHLDWFDRFFGKRPGARFHLALGMLNGPCCYGAGITVGKTEQLYCILGVWRCDKEGVPRFPKSVVPTIVHEFNHAYCNPLVYSRADKLEKAGKKIYARVAKKMKRQAYGNWKTMMHESLVRASVVRYRLANEGKLAAAREILAQHARGFAWTGGLSNLLAEYEKNRHKYPTLDAFMPRIIKFFDDYAAKLDKPAPATRPAA